ncbi:hypothetical protein C8R46DRAFT_1193867 [Mycena filopes]|nr:hypothetical protein C8R46DRAFT_1193867 [Mycena filopes]
MLHWKELSAWITVDGQGLPEYDVQISEDEKTVTCWVPSEAGKKFSVCFKASSFSHAIEGSLTLDGNSCSSAFLRRHSWQFPAEQDGVTDGTTLKPFMFSALELTDDDSFLDSSSSHPDLGVIQLTIAPVVIRPLRGPPLDISSQTLAELKLHERSKKLATQQIGLASPFFLAIVKSTSPLPRDVLRAKGIAPQLKDEKVPADALDHIPLDRPLNYLDPAVQYVLKIKQRCHPDTYHQFLHILSKYHHKPDTIDEEELSNQIARLFKDAPDLRSEFRIFMPGDLELEAKLLQTRANKRRFKDEFGTGSGYLTRDGDDSGSRRRKRVRR